MTRYAPLYIRDEKRGRFKRVSAGVCVDCRIVIAPQYMRRNGHVFCNCPQRCRQCGGFCDRPHYTLCDACQRENAHTKERARVALAKRYTLAEFLASDLKDRPVHDGNERFYYDIDTAMEEITDSELERDVTLWVCEVRNPQLDIDRAIEHATEALEVSEEVDDPWTDLDELRDFMKKWNEKQTHGLWYPMDGEDAAVVVLTKADFPEDEEEAA